MYKIGEFAKIINRTTRTLQRWDREKILVAHRSPTNRRYYTEQQLLQYKGIIATDKSINIAYIRVSSSSQKNDLKSQKQYISDFCLNKGIQIDQWLEDIGSGLNFKRKNFTKLLSQIENGEIKNLIIAHEDRLVRFGFDWFDNFCSNHGCKILVINNETLSPEQEIIQDLISIIHVFSSRVSGLRKYKKEIKKCN